MFILVFFLIAFVIGGLISYLEFQRSNKKLKELENAFEKNKEAISKANTNLENIDILLNHEHKEDLSPPVYLKVLPFTAYHHLQVENMYDFLLYRFVLPTWARELNYFNNIMGMITPLKPLNTIYNDKVTQYYSAIPFWDYQDSNFNTPKSAEWNTIIDKYPKESNYLDDIFSEQLVDQEVLGY